MAEDRDADLTFLDSGSFGLGLEGFHVRKRQSGDLKADEEDEG